MLACGVRGHEPRLWGCGPYWLEWPLSQGHRRGSHPVVGEVVHVSCQDIFGRWVTVLAVIAWRCCLIFDA
jgi:hypothetical protein